MSYSRLLGSVLAVAVTVCLAVTPAAWAGQLDKVYASDGVASMNFGSAVAMSGNSMVVGSTDLYAGEQKLGAAYVYTDNGAGDWGGEVKLLPTNTTGVGDFGNGVAIDADTIIIGANGSTVNGVAGAGTAHIFDRDGMGGWTEVATLTAGADASAAIGFGASVAISADIVLIGASKYSSNRGAVYLFGRDVGGEDNWGQIARLTASDPSTSAYFGGAVGLDGDTAIVGAYGASKAYLFGEASGSWTETKKLTSTSSTRFGISVALDDDTAVVGAYLRSVDSKTGAGRANVYSRDQGGENAWGEVAAVVSPTPEVNGYFGRAVAINGDTIVVGAYGEDTGGLVDSGAAYVFKDDGSYLAKLLPDDPAATDSFARTVALSATTICAAATKGDGVVDDTGAVYVFVPEPTSISLLIFGAVLTLLSARRRTDVRR
jgi:hypothetical protein